MRRFAKERIRLSSKKLFRDENIFSYFLLKSITDPQNPNEINNVSKLKPKCVISFEKGVISSVGPLYTSLE